MYAKDFFLELSKNIGLLWRALPQAPRSISTIHERWSIQLELTTGWTPWFILSLWVHTWIGVNNPAGPLTLNVALLIWHLTENWLSGLRVCHLLNRCSNKHRHGDQWGTVWPYTLFILTVHFIRNTSTPVHPRIYLNIQSCADHADTEQELHLMFTSYIRMGGGGGWLL